MMKVPVGRALSIEYKTSTVLLIYRAGEIKDDKIKLHHCIE